MTRSVVLILCLCVVVGSTIAGEPPAYMQATAGSTAEIKIEREKEGALRADELELLPSARRPKLRGAIEAVDSIRQAIRVFGQWITVTRETQFLDQTDTPIGFRSLKPDTRVEVSCKVDSLGNWSARHLRTQGVKSSDKIKGTISRTAYDGRSPDTLEIEGLKIIVTDRTEVFRTLGGAAEAADTAGMSEEQ
ncbi:MAG TPA: DUF5666 domain-containing protein [bacterium]|nr:DUF5666 domain-containing protein [bacterium]